MKITCPVCHTEYAVNLPGSSALRCACCGRIWTPKTRRGNGILLVFAGVIALISAGLFTAVVLLKHRAENAQISAPLVVHLGPVQPTITNGEKQWIITGEITNRTDRIQGISSMLVIMKNENNEVLGTQKFLPPTPLLDGGESVTFKHTVTDADASAVKFGIEFVKE
ncbi:MAG: zinc-ribbon domain-containing protein [Alphaproteobacteria bacterium]|nr:zinc-ribbon domain-containing protein [Alphaproteobacteria bacterium]